MPTIKLLDGFLCSEIKTEIQRIFIGSIQDIVNKLIDASVIIEKRYIWNEQKQKWHRKYYYFYCELGFSHVEFSIGESFISGEIIDMWFNEASIAVEDVDCEGIFKEIQKRLEGNKEVIE